jgi:hypothetical protein
VRGRTRCLTGNGGGQRLPNFVEIGSGGRLRLWQQFMVLALQSLEFWGDRDSHEACPHVQKRYEDEGIMWVCSP